MTTTSSTTAQDVLKPIHTILLDTAPILLNTPSISTLLASSHSLVTTSSVLAEVRGQEARNRLETLYMPFLTVRSPKEESIKLVKDFARRTGDSGVLSATDFEVLALAYDLECERNGGNWRLRKVPGQKKLNGSPPMKVEAAPQDEATQITTTDAKEHVQDKMANLSLSESVQNDDSTLPQNQDDDTQGMHETQGDVTVAPENAEESERSDIILEVVDEANSSDSDDGWITPSNIKRHQAKDELSANTTKNETKVLQVATMTGDFAMQNVLLQMNLNLLSTKTCKRVAHIKQMILRCHGCFGTTKDMSKQFCPRCGQATLTRVTCTTNDKGEVKLHLKANHQWNNRGNVFSIPKPTAGTANQKWKGPQQGGGIGGWGNGLILTEDQKEYSRAVSTTKRTKKKDLMDEDVLPSILTGDRDRSGGKIRIGAGRNINSRKR